MKVAIATPGESEKNSLYRVAVTSHSDFPETRAIAVDLLKRLTDTGFKAIDAHWHGIVPRKFDSVQVHYKPERHALATEVAHLIREILDARDLPKAIEAVTDHDMTPLDGCDVVIFVGG